MNATQETTRDHYTGRLEDVRELLERINGDDADDREQAQDELYEYPLSVEVTRTVTFVLGTGGPHDEVQIDVSGEGDVKGGRYHYWWRGMPGHGTVELDADEAQEWADAFSVELFLSE